MTDKGESNQACCESTVGDTTDESQRCCEEPQPSADSPRVEIRNDCCGSILGNDENADQAVPSERPERDNQTCEVTNRDQGSASIASNQKSGDELVRMQRAADETTALLDEMAEAWQPAWSEADVASYLHKAVRDRDLETAWTQAYCPAVHAGPEASVGHVAPGDRTVAPGEILHVDFGIVYEEYVSDLQRVFYRKIAPEDSIPLDLQTAFTDVRAAIEAGRDAIVPGVPGYQVDAVARRELVSRGWDPFNHAFGHQIGTTAHERGTLLGPLWDRYGANPRGVVRRDQVYSLELGVGTTFGYVGLEEMVRVTADGTRYLVDPQTEIRLLADGPVDESPDGAAL